MLTKHLYLKFEPISDVFLWFMRLWMMVRFDGSRLKSYFPPYFWFDIIWIKHSFFVFVPKCQSVLINVKNAYHLTSRSGSRSGEVRRITKFRFLFNHDLYASDAAARRFSSSCFFSSSSFL